MYVCMYVCMYVIRMHVCKYVCICVCMYIRMYECRIKPYLGFRVQGSGFRVTLILRFGNITRPAGVERVRFLNPQPYLNPKP
jgi:hypothetical protein